MDLNWTKYTHTDMGMQLFMLAVVHCGYKQHIPFKSIGNGPLAALCRLPLQTRVTTVIL